MRNLLMSLTVFVGLVTPVKAELIQILHTNDLHSHLDYTPHKTHFGGYARMKALIDKHKGLAALNGIDTITMDGGDSMEGNLYYMADKGRRSLEAFNHIGHDVSVLGNHDYLMGAEDLEAILKDIPPSFALLAGNLKVNDSFPFINEHVKPVWETQIGDVKIGVVGITINDMLYKWRLKDRGSIKGEVEAAKHWAHYLRNRGNDIVIALTHIGVDKDKLLAANVPELDLIVGGHSHTALHEVIYQKSFNNKNTPIVQAGRYGEWLGKLILDYDKTNKELKIQSYELVANNEDTKDDWMNSIISRANQDLFELYGKDWLETVVGVSHLRSSQEVDDKKVWYYFLNDSMLESVAADMAVHAGPISGTNYPLGEVTRRDLYNGNPRTFDFQDKFGYHIYTAKVSGFWIKWVALACMNLNIPLYFSGISFKWKKKSNGKYKVWNLRHKGKRIKPFKRYKVAFSEAIIRGGLGISKWVKLLLHDIKRSEVSMWQALEEKFQFEKELHPDYLDRYYGRKGHFVGEKIDRVYVE